MIATAAPRSKARRSSGTVRGAVAADGSATRRPGRARWTGGSGPCPFNMPRLTATVCSPGQRHRRLLRARGERSSCRAADERVEIAPLHVWMAPAWQEIIWRAARGRLQSLSGLLMVSDGLLALMGSANRGLIIRTGSMSR